MLYLFLPTELHGSVLVLITMRHGAMFLRCKEGYFLFSIVLQNGYYNIIWNKFTHKRETIIAHCFVNLLLTEVFVVLCIIITVGIMEGTKLTLTSEKAAPLLKRLTAAQWSYKEPFISLSTTTIQNFTLVRWIIVEKTCSEGLVVAGAWLRELHNQCGHGNGIFKVALYDGLYCTRTCTWKQLPCILYT